MPSSDVQRAFEALSLKDTANPADIKHSYHKKALQFHPDKNGGDPRSTVKFNEIQEAYETLKKHGYADGAMVCRTANESRSRAPPSSYSKTHESAARSREPTSSRSQAPPSSYRSAALATERPRSNSAAYNFQSESSLRSDNFASRGDDYRSTKDRNQTPYYADRSGAKSSRDAPALYTTKPAEATTSHRSSRPATGRKPESARHQSSRHESSRPKDATALYTTKPVETAPRHSSRPTTERNPKSSRHEETRSRSQAVPQSSRSRAPSVSRSSRAEVSRRPEQTSTRRSSTTPRRTTTLQRSAPQSSRAPPSSYRSTQVAESRLSSSRNRSNSQSYGPPARRSSNAAGSCASCGRCQLCEPTVVIVVPEAVVYECVPPAPYYDYGPRSYYGGPPGITRVTTTYY